MRQQRRLDLAELDAEAAHLDLAVDAAEELDAAVGQPRDEIAGAIHPRAVARERIGDEPLVRSARRDASSRARRPRRRGTARRARRSAPGSRPNRGCRRGHADRPTDRHAPAEHRSADRRDGAASRPSSRSGRTRSRTASSRSTPRRSRPGRSRRRRRSGAPTAARRQLREQRRHGVEVGDALRRDQLRELRGIEQRRLADEHELRAAGQREPDLIDRRVERVRRQQDQRVARADREVFLLREHEVDDVAMLDEHALRLAGRAARVDDVREVVRARRAASAASSSARRDRIDREHVRMIDRGRVRGGRDTAAAPESSSRYWMRSAGTSGSIGRYAPPALSTPRIATIISGERSETSATIESAPTPRSTKRRATAFARSSSSAYVTRLIAEHERGRRRRLIDLRLEQLVQHEVLRPVEDRRRPAPRVAPQLHPASSSEIRPTTRVGGRAQHLRERTRRAASRARSRTAARRTRARSHRS